MSRENIQREAMPQLVAEVRMYEAKDGGRTGPALPGWGCPVSVSKTEPVQGWDALPLLRDEPLHPGEDRHLGFVFLSGQEAADALKEAGHFYLWEGRFIGEATVVG
ncbi:hypothetical protein QUC32_12335 [Novosphingobium resinovorum]|uniref:hypothetical protein n=1 Tax=Novosphingobium TaxID=165696 RepID=UPI001B3C7E94|nr:MULTISPECIES: hypothetical protein [Novosphingobium]MBF7010463.1 hypothetical protein [Novosphingobium sp. HR1a]WJM28464.1 hypothetical protein QUC32_12335 [Novosphingobium resinovorum]